MRIPSYHLPGLTDVSTRDDSTGTAGVRVEHAALTPSLLRRAIDAVLAARSRALVTRRVPQIIDAIARMADTWRRPESPWRAQALAALPATTGLSQAMLNEVIPSLFAGCTAQGLWAFVESETGGAHALDELVVSPWGQRQAFGPTLVAHISAGNVPGLALPGLIAGLLAKAAVVVKPAAGEPVLPALIARSLTATDPDLGACVAVAYWPGGTSQLDDVLLSRADVVTVEGDTETVAAVRARARGHVLGFGRRFSLAIVMKEATADLAGAVAAIAHDVSLYDQHGCLSPQVVYVETGGPATAADLAALLGARLVALGQRLPRGPLTPAEHTAIRTFRDSAEWQALAGKDVRIFGDVAGSGATVVYEADADFEPTCANRTVRVKPLPCLDALPASLGSWANHLEAVGVAGPSVRTQELVRLLAYSSTLSRICPIGRMQVPSLGWRRGGVARLGALLRWIDVENGTGQESHKAPPRTRSPFGRSGKPA